MLRVVRESVGCLGFVGMVVLFMHGQVGSAIAFLVVSNLVPHFARAPRSVEPLLTLPALSTAFPCEVEVEREATTIGVDRGAVTFVEGWLVFEGYRTSFSLSRSDVRRRDQNHLTLGESGVTFLPDPDIASAFSGALDRWYRIDTAARGISVLPPVSVHPSAFGRAWAVLVFAVAKLSLTIAVMVLASTFLHGSLWFVLLFGGPGEFLKSVGMVRRLRGLVREDRNRLENDERKILGN